MSSASRTHYTVEEYLALESQAETRHEYYRGEIYAMASASLAHNSISLNIASILRQQLKGNSYKPVMADIRLKIPEEGIYAYPDIMVISDPWEHVVESGRDSMLSPVAIIEILSPATEANDRGRKFLASQSIPALREYVLVSQFEPRIEVFTRLPDSSRRYTCASEIAATISLKSLEFQLHLRDVYDDVEFMPCSRWPANDRVV